MQPDRSLDVRGNSKRWTRYELGNNTIVPAQGAKLEEYDPWDRYRQNFGKYRTVEQPYCSLLELGKHLDDRKKVGVWPSAIDPKHVTGVTIRGPQNEADKLILDWCNKHGLLGLVPVLSTRIDVTDKVFHYRDGGEWFTILRQIEDRKLTVFEHHQRETGDEDSVTPLLKTDGHASLTWLDWRSHQYEKMPLAEKKAFFGARSPGEPFTPCRPGSHDFWMRYGEPASEIADWCVVFTHAVSLLSGSLVFSNESDFRSASLFVLRNLADSGLTPRFELSRTRTSVLNEELTPAGLLASFALMVLWDLAAGRRALRCGNCDGYFVSDDLRAAYCSPRCRNTAQSRRYRLKT